MADDDDETFPPEIQKLPTEFAFREFGRVSLIDEESDSILRLRSNLLGVANNYGLLIVGHNSGFKVFTDQSLFDAAKVEQEVKPEPLVDVPLRSSPHWLAVSADNLTIVVCISNDKGLQILFFDTRNLVNKAKPAKTPFCVLPLSNSSNDTVVSLHWNPSLENVQYLAVCVSSGSFHMLSVTNDVQEVGRKPPEFGACAACWSPRGKQVMIGRKDGSMQQYTPTLEIRRTIPVYDAVERNVKVDDILWLSTLQVAFSYTPVSDGDWQPSLFVVTLPPAKEQSKRPSWRNYEDPCYGMPQQRLAHFMLTFLDKWNLFVMGSADASETAVIAKNRKTDLWEIWNLDDSCRAQLPMEEGNEEPSPLGVGVLYTAKDRIIVDDTRECEPMPVFVMLSCDGHLSMFHMINLLSQDEYPSLIVEPQVLSPEGEREAVVSKFGSLDPNKQQLSEPVKPKLTLSSSTPMHPQLRTRQPDSSQLSTTPLHGGGLFDSDETTGKFAPRSLAFSNQSIPAVGNVREPVETAPTIPVGGLQDPKSVFKVPLAKTYSITPAKTESIPAPLSRSNTPISAQTKPETALPLDSSFSSWSGTSGNPNSARGSDTTRSSNKRRSTVALPEEPAIEQSISSQSGSSVMDGLASEVHDFEKEMEAFIAESAHLDQFVETLGQNEEKVAMTKEVETLSNFGKAIAKTTQEQHEEVKAVRDLSLESYASIQSIEMHRKRVENPAFRSALYARPLDMADLRKMKEIRTLYNHIRETMREVNNILDDQWNKMLQKKPSSLHKSKRRMKIEERETLRQAIVNQTNILHNQEMNLLLLSQQLDKLRLFNTSLQLSVVDQFMDSKKTEDFGDSADLPTLASTLIKRNKNEITRDDSSDAKSPKSSQASHISPKKAVQLSEFLASRKSAAIRTSFERKSKFIAPSLPKPRPKESQPSVENFSQSSRFSSTSEYESEESVATVESSKPSESSRSYPPGYYLANDDSTVPDKISVEIQPSIPPHRPLANMPPVYPPLQQKFVDKPSLIRGPSPPQSTSIQGSSTFTYGGPEISSPHQKPIKKFDASAPLTEAASNLNNPPKVVNIKELSDPQIINPLTAPKKFEAKPTVPQGVADEVQKVLDLVHAESPQREEGTQSPLPVPSQPFSISTSSSLGDARRAKTDPPSTSQLVPTTQSFSTPAQPTFGTTQPFSTMSKSNDVTTRPSLGMTKPAFGAQALNSAAQLSFGSQPAFATAARSSESQPTTTHIRTSSQPSSFVKLPPTHQSAPNIFNGITMLKKSASEKHIPTPHDAIIMPQGVNDKLSGPSAAPRPAMTQEITARDLLAVDAPPEGVSLSRSAIPAMAKETSTAKLQQETKDPKSENVDTEVPPAPSKQEIASKPSGLNGQPGGLFSLPGSSVSTINVQERNNLKQTDSESRPTPEPVPTHSASGSSSSNQGSEELKTEATTGGARPLIKTPEPATSSETVATASEITNVSETTTTTSDVTSSAGSQTSQSATTVALGLTVGSTYITAKFGESSSFGTAPQTSLPNLMPKTSTFGDAFVKTTAGALFGSTGSLSTAAVPTTSAQLQISASGSPKFGGPSTFGTAALTSALVIASKSSTFGEEFTSTTAASVFAVSTMSEAISSLATMNTTSGITTTTYSNPGLFAGSTSSGLFGSTSTSAGSLFGTPATSTSTSAISAGSSLFGVAATSSESPLVATGTTSTSSVFDTTLASSIFGTPSTTTISLFSQTAAITSSSSSFGVTATNHSLFGTPTTSSGSLFGAITTSSSSLFGGVTTTTSSLFGASNTTISSSAFGVPTTTTSSLFGAATGNQPGFGSTTFGALAGFGVSTTTSGSSLFGGGVGGGFGSSGGGFGSNTEGGFLSGLGGTPKQSSTSSNPFATVTTVQSSDNKSLFGGTASSPFSSTFGQTAGSTSGFASNTNEGQKGFGSFSKPASGGFGGPPTFGSPAFGANPTFGGAAQFGSSSFGSPSGFGSPSAFGSQMGAPQPTTSSSGFGSSPGFGAFASTNMTGFSALAENSGSPGGGFGTLNSQQPSAFGSGGFGSTSSSSAKPSFTGWR